MHSKEELINLINNFIYTSNLTSLYQATLNYVEDTHCNVTSEQLKYLFNSGIILFIVQDIIKLITSKYKINEIYNQNNQLIKVY